MEEFGKAVVMVKPGELEIKSFVRPKVSKDSMLLRILMTGVCGTDLHMYEGRMPKAPFPLIPGHEILGEVLEMGDGSDRMEGTGQALRPGDRVVVVPSIACGRCFYCKNVPSRPNLCDNRIAYGISMSSLDPPHFFGGYAEFLYVRPGSTVHKVPEEIPNEVAVLSEPMSIATRALERAFMPGIPYAREGFGLGKSVVIQGAGPIGLLILLAARIAGAGDIIVTDMEDYRLQKAKEFGASHTINIARTTQDDRVRLVQELTNGVGADVVVEAAGAPQAFAEGILLARRGGKLIEVGHFTDPGTVEVRPYIICNKDLDIMGSWSSPHQTQFKTVLSLFKSFAGKVPFEKLVTHKFEVEEAEKALRTIKEKRCLKAVIAPGIGKDLA